MAEPRLGRSPAPCSADRGRRQRRRRHPALALAPRAVPRALRGSRQDHPGRGGDLRHPGAAVGPGLARRDPTDRSAERGFARHGDRTRRAARDADHGGRGDPDAL
ncbi:hypothetical protein ACRAWD_02700 [Caulobacter segnis]